MGGGGGAKNTFFSVTLYKFQKSGRTIALGAPPPPWSLTHFHKRQGDGNETFYWDGHRKNQSNYLKHKVLV